MRPLPNLPRKTWFGFGLIYLAGLGWLACIMVPFTSLPHKVIVAIIALAIAETSFLIGVALLGKAYYAQIKERFIRFIRKP